MEHNVSFDDEVGRYIQQEIMASHMTPEIFSRQYSDVPHFEEIQDLLKELHGMKLSRETAIDVVRKAMSSAVRRTMDEAGGQKPATWQDAVYAKVKPRPVSSMTLR
jgi:20S proteasome alpha/beta subunit